MKALIIGVAGGSASGKTFFARKLFDTLKDDALIIVQDDYYKDQTHKTMEERKKTNYDHPSAFDNELLKQHLQALKEGKAIDKPTYDYTQHNRSEVVEHVEPKKIIIIEGIFVLASEVIREMCDVKIFVKTPDDIRFIRRLVRDVKERGRTVENVVDQYLTTVRPMHHAFIEPSMEYADVIVPADKDVDVAVDLVISHMSNYIQKEIS